MNLKLIDAAIAAYEEGLEKKDRDRLEFFRSIWAVQQRVADELDLAWTPPEVGRAAKLVQGHVPLLHDDPLTIDASALSAVIVEILAVLSEKGAVSAEAQEKLAALDWTSVCESAGVLLAGSQPSEFLESMTKALETRGVSADDARLGAMATSLSLKPFLEVAAERSVRVLKDAASVQMHSLLCPVCGSAPSVGKVGGAVAKGRHRSLWCPQCGTEWPFERVRCARCGTTNQGHLHFFNIEGDDAHRIASCDECGGYVRVVYVDEEKLLAPFSFEVEDVLMARLDAIAADPSFAGAGREDMALGEQER